MSSYVIFLVLFVLIGVQCAIAQSSTTPLVIDISAPPPVFPPYPINVMSSPSSRMSPSGVEWSMDQSSLTMGGQPTFLVAASLHYSRVPRTEWAAALRDIRAGGINAIQTYIFWNHHQPTKNATFNWNGQLSLSDFISMVASEGLKLRLRTGPWSHGEVRGGGFPDWVENSGTRLRTTDPAYLSLVRSYYREVHAELKRCTVPVWWSEGGPIVEVQVENETGDGDYLLALKSMLIEEGILPPLYSHTWPPDIPPMPYGSMLMLTGAYADAFWSASLTREPSLDSFTIMSSVVAPHDISSAKPIIGVEYGGGMAPAYHRRPLVTPFDVASSLVAQVGSGASSLGYYIYRGGTNPSGYPTLVNEQQCSGGAQDLPAMDYDYASPLGMFNQVRPHYHYLRKMHLMIAEMESWVTTSSSVLPVITPPSPADTTILRWSVRGGGKVSTTTPPRPGLLSIVNYIRQTDIPEKHGIRFALSHGWNSTQIIPSVFSSPLTIAANSTLFLPTNILLHTSESIDQPVVLVHATAELLTSLPSVGIVVFIASSNNTAEFAFGAGTQVRALASPSMPVHVDDNGVVVVTGVQGTVTPNTVAFEATSSSASSAQWLRVVLLCHDVGMQMFRPSKTTLLFSTDAQTVSMTTRGTWNLRALINGGRTDGDTTATVKFSLLQSPTSTLPSSFICQPPSQTIFRQCQISSPCHACRLPAPTLTSLRSAGPLRHVVQVSGKAVMPETVDFTIGAAEWRINLGFDIQELQAWSSETVLMRVPYVGDVARLLVRSIKENKTDSIDSVRHITTSTPCGTNADVDGSDAILLLDNFYSGLSRPFEYSLSRLAAQNVLSRNHELVLQVLPLQRGSPIYLEDWPEFGDSTSVLWVGDISLSVDVALTAV